MTSANPEQSLRERDSSANTMIRVVIAASIALLHIFTNNRYGFHRDELQFLSDARHLDWGFVPYPPFTAFVERISLSIFGLSMVGLRFASVIAQAVVIVVTGLIARELGGGRLAQATAALAVSLSTLSLFEGTEFQYTTFDYLWWVLIAYFVVRLLTSENPRWWLAIGAVIGVGFETKYTMGFYACGILGGVLLTWARRYLLSGWFWAGMALALLIFMPNLIRQVRHDFISLHFLQHIHNRDVGQGRAKGFWIDQFWICTNLSAAPLWIAGLLRYLRHRRYRMLACMYLVPLALFVAGKGRGYYLGAAYAMLLAMGAVMGAVMGERWVRGLSKAWRRTVEGMFFTGLVAWGLLMMAVVVPLATRGPLMKFALENNGDLREEIGRDELVKTVVQIRDSLPPDQQQNLGIAVRNYGEQGAIEILGQPYHLPPPISGVNSSWLRGYPTPVPSTIIVMGQSRNEADRLFTTCHLAGHNGNSLGIKNEESEDHPDIFVCGPPRLPWLAFWKEYQSYG